MIRRILILVVLFTADALLWAQNPANYSRRFYHLADGLPEATVQAFAETPDHVLWIGTTGGLVRFDGSRFETYDRDNTPVFTENSVFCLLTDRDGSLWIGMEGSGLIHLEHGKFTAFRAANGLTDSFVRALAQDSAGRIWVGTNNGLFRVIRGATSRLERVDATRGFPSVAVNAILEDKQGRFWLGGSSLVCMQGGVIRQFSLPGEATRNRVKSIAETRNGAIWVGTVSGVFRLLPGGATFQPMRQIHGTARALREIGNYLWVSIVGRGVRAYKLDEVSNLVEPKLITSDTVLAVFNDDEQDILVGTDAGMVRYSPTPLSIVRLPQPEDSDFETVYLAPDSTLWVASSHLYWVRKGVPKRDDRPELRNLRVRNVLQDRDGSLWFGTDGSGLLHRMHNRLHRYTVRDGLANNYVRAMLQARDGSLWVGTDEGVSHLQNGIFTTFDMAKGLAYQSIRALLEDYAGDIWIGTEQGLSHLHNGKFLHDVAVQTLRQDKVWALHEDADHSLWLGTRNDGLFRLKKNSLTRFSTAEGLPSHTIYDIEEDAAGHFWMSGPTGISLLDRHELDQFAEHSTQHLSITFYAISGESETAQIFGGMQPAGAISDSGDVWFPSNRGPVYMSRFLVPQVPPSGVLISKVTADGREVDASHTITLPSANSRLEFTYQAITLRPQDSIRFKYKLDGLDREWNDAGTRHVADYTNLPPGTYTFRVAAYQLSDPLRSTETMLTLRKTPYFYSTWWFVGTCLLVLSAAIFCVYRLSVAQMRRRFQAVLEERTRLAREMHDTLLQGCAGVSAVLEAVSCLDSEQAELTRTLVDSARTQIRSTIIEAREAVWALRHQREVPQDLSGLMEALSQQLSRATGIRIKTCTVGEQFSVDRPVAHELVMVAREAIYNAAHHAAPTRVDIRLDFRPDSLTMGVQDDGCGFDPAHPRAGDLNFGIIGMQERIVRLGGTFDIVSRVREGTSIEVVLPRRATRRAVLELSV